jgi:hypothetical protein
MEMETTASIATTELDLNQIKDEPRLCVKRIIGPVDMVGNDKCLLYFPLNQISILNEDGEEQRAINCTLQPRDICWSSYLNQFLVLTYDKVYLVDPIGNANLSGYEFNRSL